MKLKSISFENYKAFKEKQTLEIRPITLLIGKNSSGKSAVAKLFTLLENSLSGNIKEPLLLNNNGVELGAEFRDLVYNRENGEVKFSLTFSDDITLSVSIIQPNPLRPELQIYEWKLGSKDQYVEYFREENIFKNENNETIYIDIKDFLGLYPNSYGIERLLLSKHFDQEFDIIYKTLMFLYGKSYQLKVDYIGPFRVLPQRQFYFSGGYTFFKTGIKGENAYPMLAILSSSIRDKIGKWYEKHFDGWKLLVNDKNRPHFEILLSKNNLEVNIMDTGQGMNQALPLVVCASIPKEDSIIVLEQPELHLHPAAHADLAELFAKSAKTNNQSFVIETHSENMLLRLRKLVVENDFGFTKDDIIIYWIDAAEHGGQQLNPITIDEEGDLSDFPEGVFNENLKEILELDKALNRKNKA